MRDRFQRPAVTAALAAACLVTAFAAGTWVAAQAPAPPADAVPAAPAALKSEEPANRGLDANLYMQTSAEYRACCYQAYNLATAKLDAAAAKDPDGKLAVVVDLDETVFDNAGFQAMQLRSNLAYDQRLWDLWEEKHPDQVGLIPGARDFLLRAAQLKVCVAYVSNRSDKFRTQTAGALARLGVPAGPGTLLLLSTDTTDKTARRREVEAGHTVVLYLGDNLRDFDEAFRCPNLTAGVAGQPQQAVRARKDAVDRHRAAWGDKWVIFPNPAYGEWLKPLGQGRSDLDLLAPPLSPKPVLPIRPK